MLMNEAATLAANHVTWARIARHISAHASLTRGRKYVMEAISERPSASVCTQPISNGSHSRTVMSCEAVKMRKSASPT